jgi:hypothetical protein
MNLHLANPFAGSGSMVEGDRFTGRSDDLEVIDSRVLRDSNGGSLAIIGERLIGKSSLAHKATIERKEELHSKGIIPIWINVALCETAGDFFLSLVSLCRDELYALGLLSDTIKLAANEALQDGVPAFERNRRTQDFFKRVRMAGRRVIFVLDEFDRARDLFKNNIVSFQKLRELAYQPDWRVHYITISRRSIKSIETISQAISTFHLTLEEHYLGVFTANDLEKHFNRYSEVGLTLSADMQDRVLFYSGGHPYLLDLLGFKLVDIYQKSGGSEPDVDAVFRHVEYGYLNYFERLIEYIREGNKLQLLLDTLFTQSTNMNSEGVNEFIRYGLIKHSPDGRLIGLSEYFHEYLKLVERQSDLRSIWGETEVALRSFITATLEEHYGTEWLNRIEKAHSHIKLSVFDPCRERQTREKKLFKERASGNLVDYTYPADMFAIIFAEWNLFQPTLGSDKTYWGQRAALLSKIRTVIGHWRDVVLTNDQRRAGEAFCGELLTAIQSSYRKQTH